MGQSKESHTRWSFARFDKLNGLVTELIEGLATNGHSTPILSNIESDRITESAPVLFLSHFGIAHHDVKKQRH